jgi:hypothetical protein
MSGERRSEVRWVAAFGLAVVAGIFLVATMYRLDLDGGLLGAVLWIVIAVLAAAVFTAALDGPGSLVRLVRGGRQR